MNLCNPVDLTEEQEVKFTELVGSKKWRLANFNKIKSKTKKTISLILNKSQSKLHKLMYELKRLGIPTRILVLKPRQIGITTFFANFNLDSVTWLDNQFCAVVAHQWLSARTIFNEIVRFAYNNYPEHIRVKAYQDSINQLHWKKKASQILVTADLHGLTPNILHVTEVARLRGAKEMLSEGYQSVPKDGVIIEESTANGVNNYFYDKWYETYEEKVDNGWIALFLKWWEHEEYTLNKFAGDSVNKIKLTRKEKQLQKDYGLSYGNLLWRRWKIAECGGSRVDMETGLSGEKIFQQNYPMTPSEAFLVTGGSCFDIEILAEMMRKAPENFHEKQYGIGSYKMYRRKKNIDYIISVDTSEGTGKDFSAVTVIDPEKLQIVSTLRGKYRTQALAKCLDKLGRFYNNAELIIERNNHGHAVIAGLEHLDYPKLYYWADKEYGFPTTKITRLTILDCLEDAIANKLIKIPDKQTITEMLNFGFDKRGKARALKGNDDTVMSTAIGVYIATQYRHAKREIPLYDKPAGM